MAKEEVVKGKVEIVRTGEKIMLPEGMSYDEGCTWLQRQKAEEEQVTKYNYVVDAFPLEGAYALRAVLDAKYGHVKASGGPPSMFEPITYPTLVGIETGVGKTEQVPWGGFQVPGIAGAMYTGIALKDGRLQFRLFGETLNKHKQQIADIVDAVRERVRTASIYRGQAIRVSFEEEEDQLNPEDCPKFIDVSKVDPSQLIFSADIERIVKTTLFTPIEHTAECRQYGVPLKRGVLLEGPFGVGKSLTAAVVAKKCVENGWTFITLADASQLAQAIEFARQYQPAVIFAEDIDRVVKGERTADMDQILNVIDGVGSKALEVFVVLTTNDVASINRAMLRPGRLDAVVTVEAPDAEAAQRLIRLYGRGLLDEGEDLAQVGKMLDGRIPAVIREVVERSKLAAISRLGVGEPLRLKSVDLEIASDTMIRHLELLREIAPDTRSNMEKAAAVLVQGIAAPRMPQDALTPLGRGNGAPKALEGPPGVA